MTNKIESVYKPGIYIPNNVLSANIPPSAKILYGALQGFPSFELEGVYASRRTLGKIVHCSSQRITELVKVLVDNNFIFFNGQKKMNSGEKIRLLKRVPPNEKSLDPPNEKSLIKKRYNNNIYTSDSPNGESQREIDKDERPFYYKNRNGIRPCYIRFCEQIQKKIIQANPSKFKQYPQQQIDKKILDGAMTIDKLIRIDSYDFDTEIKPCLLWAIEDEFWSEQIRSIAPLRNKSKNKETKFTNIFDSWTRSKKSKPKKQSIQDRLQMIAYMTDNEIREYNANPKNKKNKITASEVEKARG